MLKIILTAFMFFNFSFVYAHSGNTNGDGCHNDRINGGYHCHNKKLKSSHLISNSKNCSVIKKEILQCNKSKEEEQIKYLKAKISDLENKLSEQKNEIKKVLIFRDQYLINDALWLNYSCQKYGVKYVIDAKNRIHKSMKNLDFEDSSGIRGLFKNEIKKCQN